MSQNALKEFIKNSNVDVTTDSNYNNENLRLINEIEKDLLRDQHIPQRLDRKLVNNSNYGNIVNTTKTDLDVSKLNMGMFNATVNRSLSPGDRVDLVEILKRSPFSKRTIPNGLTVEVKEIRGYYGQFKVGYSSTLEYGQKGDLNQKFFTVQFAINVSNGTETKGWTINIYKNGKIRFSGGFVGTDIERQAEEVRNYVVTAYTTGKYPFLYNAFEYNNLSGQFKVNGTIRLFELHKNYVKYGLKESSYEPELSPFLFAKYTLSDEEDATYIISSTGNVQISGVRTPGRMLKAYNIASDIMHSATRDGIIRISAQKVNSARRKNSSSCPKNRQPPCKTGFEERKNKKGFTCCYKIPKTKKMAPRGNALPIVNGDMIGKRRCDRYSQPELYDIAKRLGIVNIKKTTKKEDLCAMIKKVGGEKAQVAAFKNGGKEYRLTGTGNTFRIGKKMAKLYTKDDLVRFAKIMKVAVNVKNDKMTIAKKLEKERNAIAAKPKTPPPKPEPKPSRKNVAQQKRNVKKQEVIKKRGLDEASIRRDITLLYGKRWMQRYNPSIENDVREMKTKLNGMGRLGNKRGIPFKKDVDLVKKRMVQRWKNQRGRALERKFIMNQLNTTNIPNALKNKYKNAAVNYIMTQGPTMSQLNKYKNTWINLHKGK
jgi:TATA-box binding protein (TBP) (component of TFIID and TFIIIB)